MTIAAPARRSARWISASTISPNEVTVSSRANASSASPASTRVRGKRSPRLSASTFAVRVLCARLVDRVSGGDAARRISHAGTAGLPHSRPPGVGLPAEAAEPGTWASIKHLYRSLDVLVGGRPALVAFTFLHAAPRATRNGTAACWACSAVPYTTRAIAGTSPSCCSGGMGPPPTRPRKGAAAARADSLRHKTQVSESRLGLGVSAWDSKMQAYIGGTPERAVVRKKDNRPRNPPTAVILRRKGGRHAASSPRALSS